MTNIPQVILAALLALMTAQGALDGSPAPGVCLEDQYGLPFDLHSHRGHVIVLLAGDRRGAEQNHAWGQAIGERFGKSVLTVGVADATGVPFFLKESVRRSFEGERVRVLMDWEGRTFQDYGFAAGTANVVVIDGSGIIRFICAGSLQGDLLQNVFEAITNALDAPQR